SIARLNPFTLSIQVASMTRNYWFPTLSVLTALLSVSAPVFAAISDQETANNAAPATISSGSATEFFDAVDSGQLNAKLIVMNDHEARLILTNNTKQPLNLKLPEAFAGVPVAAQFGAGGGARGGGGGARGGGGR